jgi:hypothetical protein
MGTCNRCPLSPGRQPFSWNRAHFRSLLAAVLLNIATCNLADAAEAVETESPMNSVTIIETIFDPLLTERGFVRSGLSWYAQREDSVLWIELQPAKYAPVPYVNLSVSYRKYGTVADYKDLKFQVTTRLEGMVPDPAHVAELLDPQYSISNEDRAAELQGLIVMYGLPWLEGLARFDTARSFLERRTSKAVFVVPEARGDLQP